MKAKKKQAVIELHIGNMGWVYYVALFPVMVAAAVQRAKAWILKRETSKVYVNCEVAGFVPGGDAMTTAQAADFAAVAVSNALKAYQKTSDKQLLELTEVNCYQAKAIRTLQRQLHKAGKN